MWMWVGHFHRHPPFLHATSWIVLYDNFRRFIPCGMAEWADATPSQMKWKFKWNAQCVSVFACVQYINSVMGKYSHETQTIILLSTIVRLLSMLHRNLFAFEFILHRERLTWLSTPQQNDTNTAHGIHIVDSDCDKFASSFVFSKYFK